VIEHLVAGLAVSALVSLAGWRANALSPSGAAAAMLVGTAIAVGASWPGVLVLGTFFVLSSALSKIRVRDDVAEKGSRRDALQVLANGGVAAVVALVGLFGNEQLALALVAASLAAATADTWATEIGSTAHWPPRMLISRRPVARGESGGVTRRGTLAAIAGALCVGAVAGVAAGVRFDAHSGVIIAVVATLGGIAGSTVDSLAGELIQERRLCPSCRVNTEARVHRCGTSTEYRGGIPGITNDVVNAICTGTGATLGLLAVFL
jgi:uncharacterized protein (TIGR00297 family)